jgi:hypothetical protein
VLLAAVPDGSLLRADPAALPGTPFSDWRVPGVLLAGLVGGGFLLAGWWQWRGYRHARGLSMAAGAGLVCFEAAELAWIGFQPLEALCATVGVIVIGLAWRLPKTQPRSVDRRGARVWAPSNRLAFGEDHRAWRDRLDGDARVPGRERTVKKAAAAGLGAAAALERARWLDPSMEVPGCWRPLGRRPVRPALEFGRGGRP